MRTRDIKKNALYSFNGIVCRVKKQLKNKRFLVTHHKSFYAIASGAQLKKIDSERVRNYLIEAGVDV